ncbi:FAD binding domain-containing protein [Streptomyces sp. NRRL S-1868]|uniref:FAD binding domain-containing protein n=1 Tax=Streptomyces sp. NRRL S-1868 TaxID=1463892 RepID=UPI0004C969AE|nr:xanthine dehydrogenase family protein subunit M [Streptomyces sp. NRRL S-1868]
MKPGPFDYIAPTALPEALRLLSDTERDGKVLAGGQSLIPMLNMRLARPELLVDITRIPELDRLGVDADGALRIGASVRQSTVAADPAVRAGWPLLAAAVERIGHPQIRNRGTVCGSLVHHDPAAELPAVALALDARFTVARAGGSRTVPAGDFFRGTFTTDVEPEEIVTEAVVPPLRAGTGWAFRELAQRRGDFAAVGLAVLLRADGAAVGSARLVYCGVGGTPVRVPEAEQALVGREFGAASRSDAARAVGAVLDPPGDVHASARWRREAAEVLLARALTEAWERTT